MSVIFDLGTIFIIFKIGQKVFSEKVGLLASLFYAISVLPVQLSHFYAVDIPLNFFIFLTLYQLILFYEKQSWPRAIWLGISFGFALATKASAALLIIPIGIIFLLKPLFGYALVILLVAVISFIIAEPYALLDFPVFWEQIQAQNRMTKDAFTFPYTLQYVDTAPYFYHLKNLWLWGMGVGLGSISFLATLWYFLRFCQRRRKKEIILVVFFLTYFLVVGKFSVKFMRYLLPLYPLFCLFSSWFLEQLRQPLKKTILALVSLGALVWLMAFLAIYSQPNTRVLASQWINQNIPQGSKLAVEHWDDRVPIWGNYQFLEMTMYEPDTSPVKWQKVDQNLQQADYLIIASNRLYAPLQKLASCEKYPGHCYPKTARYYQQLFSGDLGFQKVAEFTSYPRLEIRMPALRNFSEMWKLEIRDEVADESFTVYDHPKVIIFKNKKKLSL